MLPLGVAIDSLAVIMFVMVTFIATLIHIYSIGYMHGDPRYPRFFAYLSLFCFSMLGLVASSNAFMIFIFWELVGVCSYLLIGFWYEEKANCDAANKAFVVNRIGDVGMLVGLGLLWTAFGTFDFREISQGLRGPKGGLHAPTTARVDVPLARALRSSNAPGENKRDHRRASADAGVALDRRGAGHIRGLRGEKRPVSAPRVATRRHGRTDSGLSAYSCRDDGGRGRLFGGAVLPGFHR